jgi:hypothetical protein
LSRRINNEYFAWLLNLACSDKYSGRISYKKLLRYLYNVEFTFLNPKDENRASDGVDLRYRFILEKNYDDMYDCIMSTLDGPCSVLEMMLALSIRCEENIMDDPAIGSRTTQWFWFMINNLGLGAMYDDLFDADYVEEIVRRFLAREYEPNGEGGLFRIKHCDVDLRTMDIWRQMCWYLDTIT